jgi:hypothetical protein
MGLINPDVYVTNQGIEKTNTYISFFGQNVNLRKTGTDPSGVSVYQVTAIACVWWDSTARESNKSPIASILVSKEVTGNAGINESLYTILYAQLKLMFPNAYDYPAFVEPAETAPTEPAPSEPAPTDP